MGRGNEVQNEKGASLWSVISALLVAQVVSGGYDVVTQANPVYGAKSLVFRVYGDVAAVLVLFPAALILERHNPLRLSRRVVAQLFLLGLIGIFGSQMLLFFGMEQTTAEFSSVMQTSIPVFTAVIALLFGVEKLNLRRRDSRSRLAGITFCCAGAILMIFYRGPPVLGWFNLGAVGPNDSRFNLLEIDDWKVGAACLIGSGLCIAVFINLQTPLLKQCPAPVSVVAYSYLFGTIIMGAASYFLVHDSSWIVDWNFNLIVVLYNGIISSALHFGLVSWALSKVGPLFVASYLPIQPISSTLLAVIFLKSILYLGSVLGTVLIILGLLLVGWAREESTRLSTLSRIVERSSRYPRVASEAHAPELRAPLLQGEHSQV